MAADIFFLQKVLFTLFTDVPWLNTSLGKLPIFCARMTDIKQDWTFKSVYNPTKTWKGEISVSIALLHRHPSTLNTAIFNYSDSWAVLQLLES